MFDEKYVFETIMADAKHKAKAKAIKKERKRVATRDSQRMEFLRAHNVSDEVISAMLALK